MQLIKLYFALGEGAFSGTKIKAITIPTSVTNIGNYAFSSCAKLQSITIPTSVTIIGITIIIIIKNNN